MSETGDTGGMVVTQTCRCGLPGNGDLLVIERPPRVVLSATCPEHGRVVRQGVGPDELLRLLEAGASVRWPDLSSAALCVALLTCGTVVPTVLVDLDAQTLFSNPAWSALTGLSGTASQGQRWLSALVTEGPGTLIGAILADTAIQVTIAFGADRDTRWALVPQPILGARGRPLGHLVLLVDSRSAPVASSQPVMRASAGRASISDLREEVVARVAKALDRIEGEQVTIAVTLVQVEQLTTPAPTRPAAVARSRVAAEKAVPVTDGDVLRALEVRLIDLARPGDVVLDLGDGCFALLTEETTSYGETVGLGQRLADEAARPLETAPDQPAMRASVGIAFPHLPDESAEDVLANAERALDAARSLGSNRVEVVIGTGPGSSDVGAV